MEYTATEDIPFYRDCAPLVEAAGCVLVELHVVPQRNSVKVAAVIARKDPLSDVGISDCAAVHRSLLSKMSEILQKPEDVLYMEVCSPGLERQLKNALEFSLFAGRAVRVWDKTKGDWVSGTIFAADTEQVTLKTEDAGACTVSYTNIAKAKFIHS
ncbi:MAG: ribosome maturation factor [Treponema sp.]|nr:ribosome maturation factor [Treponema sp.]